jgi:hypothetical protein
MLQRTRTLFFTKSSAQVFLPSDHVELYELDESFFGKKRKYHTTTKQYWALRITQRGTRDIALYVIETCLKRCFYTT